ncbi:MAG: hypothetical protein KGQ59_10480 [Bdellovibrionales bacterium]|nr:hypothetical protein [Bdellovibrionales bacterium]
MNRLRIKLLFAFSVLLFWHLDAWYTPNPSSRAMLVASLVHEHRYTVDRYQSMSEDKSLVDGHYYSDKAPLSSWVTAPLYALVSWAFDLNKVDYLHPATLVCGAIMSGVIPSLVFLWFLFSELIRRQVSAQLTVLYLIAAIPCSMIGVYSGAFFGHLLAGALLAIAWRAQFHCRRYRKSGLLLGIACLAEFPILLFVPFFLLDAWRSQQGSRVRNLFALSLGLIPGAALVCIHNLLTTGNALEFAYKHVDSPSFQHMKFFYGFSYPRPEAVWSLLVSPSHGLAFTAPVVLVLTLAFLIRGLSSLRSAKRHMGLWGCVGFFLMVSSYQMWEGGWAFGPRHLIPILMILLFEGISLIPKRASPSWLWGLGSSCVFGGCLVFFAKATSVYMIPSWIKFPLTELFIPQVQQGKINPNVVLSWLLPVSPAYAHLLWALILILISVVLAVQARALEGMDG